MCDRYPRGYRDDEEMYVYDQHCANCIHDTDGTCPLYIDDDLPPYMRVTKEDQEENGTFKDGELDWCINWKGKKGSRF